MQASPKRSKSSARRPCASVNARFDWPTSAYLTRRLGRVVGPRLCWRARPWRCFEPRRTMSAIWRSCPPAMTRVEPGCSCMAAIFRGCSWSKVWRLGPWVAGTGAVQWSSTRRGRLGWVTRRRRFRRKLVPRARQASTEPEKKGDVVQFSGRRKIEGRQRAPARRGRLSLRLRCSFCSRRAQPGLAEAGSAHRRLAARFRSRDASGIHLGSLPGSRARLSSAGGRLCLETAPRQVRGGRPLKLQNRAAKRAIGISVLTVLAFEQGLRRPREETLIAIRRAFRNAELPRPSSPSPVHLEAASQG